LGFLNSRGESDKSDFENSRLVSGWLKVLEGTVDWGFSPMDGENHCYHAYAGGIQRVDYKRGSFFNLAVLSIFIIPACFIIGAIARILVLAGARLPTTMAN
jgi:hypothetical protein